MTHGTEHSKPYMLEANTIQDPQVDAKIYGDVLKPEAAIIHQRAQGALNVSGARREVKPSADTSNQ